MVHQASSLSRHSGADGDIVVPGGILEGGGELMAGSSERMRV